MNLNVNNNIAAQNIAGSLQTKQAHSPKNLRTDSVSSTVKAKYADIIDKALKGDAVNPELVKEAKELLASGQLDSPEFAKKAAQRLLSLGL